MLTLFCSRFEPVVCARAITNRPEHVDTLLKSMCDRLTIGCRSLTGPFIGDTRTLSTPRQGYAAEEEWQRRESRKQG